MEIRMSETFKIIQDPINGPIKIPDRFMRIIDTGEFQRLRNIRQLGMCHYVFPGANHTRFEHSIGTFHLAAQFADTLNIIEKDLICAAALLHDIGHPPISHGIEDFFQAKTGLDHVDAGKKIIMGEKPFDGSVIPDLLEKMGLEPSRVCSIIDGTSVRDRLPSRIISGPMDVDEMDYLRRDSVFCGVNVGNIDYRRIMNVALKTEDDLHISRKGVNALEGLLISRILMYSSVYFHKTSRIAQGMLKIALSGIDLSQDPFSMDDTDIFTILKKNPQIPVAGMILRRDLFKPVFRAKYSEENLKRVMEKITQNRNLDSDSVFVDVIPPVSFKGPGRVKSDLTVIDDGDEVAITDLSPLVGTLEKTMGNKEILISCTREMKDLVTGLARSLF